MKNLHSLIHNLHPSEIEIIRASLKSYYSKEETDFKTLKLFDFLLSSKKDVPDANTCSLRVYNKPKDNTIDKLASRLKAKVLDALTLDVNIERKGVMDDLDASVVKVKKKMMQFLFLYRSRGHQPLTNLLLDDVISYSRKYEIYEAIVESLRYKKFFKGYTRGIEDYNKLNEEISFFEHCANAVSKAGDYYYKIIIRNDFHGNVDKLQRQKYLLESVEDLKGEYAYTKSATVGYYLKLLELAYLHDIGDMKRAREVCLEQLEILKSNKSVYRKQRVGIAYGNIGQCDVYLGDFENAVNNARAFVEYIPVKAVNYVVAKEQEFHALFYGGRFAEAATALRTLLNLTSSQQGDFRAAKFRFYQANVLFRTNSFKEALRDLLQNAELSKDKIGWEIAIRVLTIMTYIELDGLDEAEKQVDSLRKHMDRHEKHTDIRMRDQIILKYLQRLQKKGFVFGKPGTEDLKALDLLASDEKKYKWEPFSPELIPFHHWVKKKHKGKS